MQRIHSVELRTPRTILESESLNDSALNCWFTLRVLFSYISKFDWVVFDFCVKFLPPGTTPANESCNDGTCFGTVADSFLLE